MPNVIEAIDKDGIRISCSLDQWNNHIIDGHPIMSKNIDAVKETIVCPDYIYYSHDSNPPLDERRIYSKEVSFATYHDKTPYTKVVVSICGGYGEVVTAYNGKNPKGGTVGEALYIAEGKT